MPPVKSGNLLILTGGKSVGKTSVASEILKLDPTFHRIITYTSRPPRPGEQDGVDYFFLSEEQFQQKIRDQLFFEWVEYAGHFKGTSRSSLEQALNGQNLLWIIDPSRAVTIKDDLPLNLLRVTTVVLITASQQSQLKRFRADKTRVLNKTELEAFHRSLIEDEGFLSQADKFDQVIENRWGETTKTAQKILSLISA